MARAQSNKSTLVIMVRHGRTPTTGKVLPGRAPGLHLADSGLIEAETVAKRLSEIKGISAVYASARSSARRCRFTKVCWSVILVNGQAPNFRH
jgi:probable phosphoglycerate mutase